MNVRSLALALALGGPFLHSPAPASPATDPRTPINAVETPGDADSVFRITQPGSYYLEANLEGVAGKSGIEIDASNVRIDLMGFRLNGANGGVSAIRVPQERINVSIENGNLTVWGSFGVDGVLAQAMQVRNLEMTSCEVGGIRLGARADVENCRFIFSSGAGIVVGSHSTVSRSKVGLTSVGIETGSASFVEHCKVENVTSVGIQVDSQSTVRSSIARFCGGSAISLDTGSSVLASTASHSVAGIFGSGSVRVIDSTMQHNALYGVRIDTGVVRGCSIGSNGQHGVEIADHGAQVVGNLIASNGLDGIRSHVGSRIEDNDIRGHLSGAGIRTFGTGSYIVKNTLTQNTSPILVPNAGNFVGTLVSPNAINGRNDPWANLFSN